MSRVGVSVGRARRRVDIFVCAQLPPAVAESGPNTCTWMEAESLIDSAQSAAAFKELLTVSVINVFRLTTRHYICRYTCVG